LAALFDLLRSTGPLKPSYVRVVASAIVRKWLIDDNLSILSNALKVNFELPCLDTSQIFSIIEHEKNIQFFMTGGVLLGGFPIRGYYACSKPYTGVPPIPIDKMTIELLGPSKFLRSKRVYFKEQAFSAEHIIRFISNKFGGVHYDETRDKAWQSILEEASEYFTVGNPHGSNKVELVESDEPGGPVMLVLPLEERNIWTCLDIELLSMAQSLCNLHCNGKKLLVISNSE